jgi:mRNA interferase HigB
MHIITQTRLRDFAKKHPAADTPLRVWEAMVRGKKYKNPHEVKTDFGGSVDFIGNGKTVFDVGGNKYRVVCKMLYKRGWCLIRWVLTHKEYNQKIEDGTL